MEKEPKVYKDTRSIYERMADAMGDIKPIEKDRVNLQQKFKFRGVDDAFNMLQPILAKHGIFLKTRSREPEYIETTTKEGGRMRIYRVFLVVSFVGRLGDKITTGLHGEGFDAGDKGLYKAYSNALKYVLFQSFAIPTDEIKDVEHDSHIVNGLISKGKQPKEASSEDKTHNAYKESCKRLKEAYKEHFESELWGELGAALLAKDYETVKAIAAKIKIHAESAIATKKYGTIIGLNEPIFIELSNSIVEDDLAKIASITEKINSIGATLEGTVLDIRTNKQ